MAWLWILSYVPGVLGSLVYMTAGGGVALGVLRSEHPEFGERMLGALASGYAVTLLVITLPFILPWVFLLKRHVWAWWVLTIGFGLGTAIGLSPLLELRTPRHDVSAIAILTLGGLAISCPSLLFLLTDRPSLWKGARRSKSRKRRSRKSR